MEELFNIRWLRDNEINKMSVYNLEWWLDSKKEKEFVIRDRRRLMDGKEIKKIEMVVIVMRIVIIRMKEGIMKKRMRIEKIKIEKKSIVVIIDEEKEMKKEFRNDIF